MKLVPALLLFLPLAGAAQVVNPAVTQGNIRNTICVPGWTKTVRPPVSYTNRIKRGLLVKASRPWSDAHLYELDHDVPIEVGGHPRDPKNLKLQLWDGPDGAHAKDRVENNVHHLVCAGSLTLAAGQACFMRGWKSCPR